MRTELALPSHEVGALPRSLVPPAEEEQLKAEPGFAENGQFVLLGDDVGWHTVASVGVRSMVVATRAFAEVISR